MEKESILESIKKLLGIDTECTDFDVDIIIHINTVLMQLNQIGIGKNNYTIQDDKQMWSDFCEIDKVSPVKTYVYLKVRLLFDPPINASVIESFKENIKEIEWRLNIKSETKLKEV